MADIFLSYSEKDREAARRIAELLESSGWSVWWDRRIPAGENWRSVLDRALETTRCMVVLWSANSVRSEWVCEEASEGRRLNRLIPVLIEQVRPPAGFREIQAADLVGWDGSRTFPAVQELIRDLTDRLGKPVAASEAVVESEPRGRVSRSQVGTATEKLDGVASEASDDVGHRGPRQAESPWRFTPWLVGGAFALAAGIFMSSLGKQAHRDLETAPAMVSPRTSAFSSPPAEEKPAERVATTPDVDTATLPTAKVPQSPTDSTVVTTTSPPSKTATAPKSIQFVPSESSDVKAGDVKAGRKPKTQISASKGAESSRCSDLLQELQLGAVLSDEKRAFFEKECKR